MGDPSIHQERLNVMLINQPESTLNVAFNGVHYQVSKDGSVYSAEQRKVSAFAKVALSTAVDMFNHKLLPATK